jgi:hypothetical protein
VKAVAKRLVLTAAIIAGSISVTYVVTHTHPYHGLNTGVVLDIPGHGCIGAEYWSDTRSFDAYAGDVC